MISREVVILTRAELKAREDAAFQRGVKRGEFEALAAGTRRAETRSKARAEGCQSGDAEQRNAQMPPQSRGSNG